MSSPLPAPSGSPPDVAASPPSTASPPAASSSTVPPSSSSSTPPAPPPSGDQTPPAPPPSGDQTGGDQTPPAPPPSETPSPPPPVIVSTPPPPSSSSSPPPPSSADSTPPPSTSTPPPPSTSTSPPPPPPVQSLPPPAAQSAPPPAQSEEPTPPQSSSPPPPSSAQSPPPSSSSPPPPSQSSLSPPSPPSSVSPPPPPSSTLSSPPPPPASTSSPTTPSSPTSPPSSNSTASVSGGTLAAILITGVLAASILLVLVYCFCKKKKKRYYAAGGHHGPPGGLPAHYQDSYYDPNMKQQQGWHSPQSQSSDHVLLNMPPPPPPPLFTSSEHDLVSPKGNSGIGNSKSFFTYAELATATNGFSKSNMLGEGGFGCVYKGVLSNGQVVAVKQLKIGASQGEKEFQAEVEIISRVHHRHLVSLVGYCTAESQRLLVYDYVPNNTLEYHLHKRKGGPVMDWATRIRVARGAARGLAYLHEDCHPRIIHRDIKSSNILLDNNFEAQVSDFGLAKLTSDTNTHVTTRVMGTFGYLAPEYASSGKLTEKSDVFSFGVVLLELLTGRKPVDVSQPPGQESVVEWARPLLAQVESEEDLDILVDPSLNGVYDSKEMMRMAEAAAACIRHSANKRPRMGQVVRALEDEISLSDLNRGLKPGHSSVYGSSFSSNDYENGSYSADMRRFRMALNETNNTGVSMNPSVSSSEYQTSLEIDQDTRRPMRMLRHAAFSSSNEFSAGN